MNQLSLTGLVSGKYEVVNLGDNKKWKLLRFTLKVKRPFRETEENPKVDFIKIKTWSNILQHPDETLAEENIVSIQGRVQSYSFTKPDGITVNTNEIMAERIDSLADYF